MKNIKIYSAGIAGILLSGTIILSCTKKHEEATALQNDFTNSSIVQLYVATVNASRNYVYIDAQATNGSALSSGSVFPGTGYGFNVPSGIKAFLIRDTLAAATQVPLSFAENMKPGKVYTIFAYDTINTPKQKTIETNIVVPTDSTARLRFANFVFSRTDVPGVDIYSKRRDLTLFSNIKMTEVTDFIPVPSVFNDTFYVRETGTTNLLASLNGLSPTPKRSYTLVFRGRYQTTSGTVARTLSSFVNR